MRVASIIDVTLPPATRNAKLAAPGNSLVVSEFIFGTRVLSCNQLVCLIFTPQIHNEKSRILFCRPAGRRSGLESAGAHRFAATVSSHPMFPMC